MPLGANPLQSPEALDVAVIAGVTTAPKTLDPPPITRILDQDGRPYKWDTKDKAGAEGATQTYNGWKIGKFKLRIECWTAEQIDYVEDTVVPLLRLQASKASPKPVSIYHVLLQARDVNACVIQQIGPWVDLGRQLWSVTVECEEFRPAKKQNASTTPGSQKNNDKDGSGKPNIEDRLDAEIAKTYQQWKRALPPRRS